ncbi:restriction endonuclease subunit S [Campylobacter concisus]|jgi:restriction modification system DNA specificity domain protein|uniref:restriction endonuclease subunit S n=1 Tax=Campylobacter concisus TaxID=199 RepID=UPI000CD96238|nr:restriction endonuclease subunit S [Campylobacter concisus]MCA6131408.1 restriction endonuclease subunit S [Campylobacter concisus]MCA6131733.1 restriction endonuclease subunit S [Campylobacter concisus]
MSEFKNLPSGWKVMRLGDVAEKSILKNRNNLIKLVLSNSAIDGLVAQNEYFDKDIANKENIQDYYIVDLGDFVYNPRISQSAPTGPINRNMLSKGIVSPLYTVFTVQDEILAKFLAYFFKTIVWQNQVKSVANYGARYDRINITDNAFFSLKILLPPLDEQKKIAEILSTCDEAINLTINLIESKKQFKKALMQNLLTAKIRFPQFKDEWEETKLGEICDISTGTSKSRFIGDGKFYIVDMGSITQDGLLNLTKTTNLSQDFLDFGDLVMPKDDIGGGKIIGKVAVIDKDNTYVLSDHIFRIKTTENSNFLAYLINSDLINKKIRREVSGTAQLGLSKRTIENLKIKLPNLKEQQKIAEVLTACDDEINLLNLKLENLKKQKQGLMQKLLKGEIRTCYVKKAM